MLPRNLPPRDSCAPAEPIAVIGMGVRLPGGTTTPGELWDLLAGGRGAVREGPFDRWAVDAFYSPESDVPGRTVSRWGGFLDDIAGFDAEFFGISRREADAMDPQARMLLELAWEALERAGIPPRSLEGRAVGVFAGLCHSDYLLRMAGRFDGIEAYTSSGTAHSTAAGRISYLLGLRGPSMAVDTACSSALVSVHLACQSLRSGDCALALAGGANAMVVPEPGLSYSRWGMLSPRGRCRPFDAEADGYVRAEGAGLVVLKRLEDARRDGDPVLAVIRGSAVNQDGRSNGLTTPSADAQRALLRSAVRSAGVDPSAIGMLEAHGAGTPVGDPMEFSALSDVYGACGTDVYGAGGTGGCALGSLKSNIGHLEAAAGVAGLIKAVLCVQHATVVPTLHFTRWNPRIDATGSRLFVPVDRMPWPVHSPTRLAGVSSFGFSGTNAHVIVESHDAPAPGPRSAHGAGPRVFAVSAHTGEALAETAARLADRLADRLRDDSGPAPLDDIAHTLAMRRSPARERLAVVADDRESVVRQLRLAAEGGPPHPASAVRGTARAGTGPGAVWVFPGQGSQWPAMGRSLLDVDAAFTAVIDALEPLVAGESGFSLRQALTDPGGVTDIAKVQPALFAMQVALAQCWRAQGVEPAAVIGHSMGEVAAAVVAGALSLDDGVRVVCRRSALMARLSGRGAMAVVGLDEDRIREELAAHDDVSVAALSAPHSTVISGATATVRYLVEGWTAREVPARMVEVDVASHSPMVDPILAELADRLACVRAAPDAPGSARPAFYSTVLDDCRSPVAFDARYWVGNLRRPVRFHHAVTAAAADGHSVFIEISPHPVLVSAICGTLAEHSPEPLVIGTLSRDDDGPAALRRALATVWAHGLTVGWQALYGSGRLVDLPVTVWRRERHWIDLPPPHPDHSSVVGSPGRHPLLGPRVALPPPATGHLWQLDLATGTEPWVAAQEVHGDAALPVAALAEMAIAAACQALDRTATDVWIGDLRVQQMLVLGPSTRVCVTAVPTAGGALRCEIRTHDAGTGEWIVHATAEILPSSPAEAAHGFGPDTDFGATSDPGGLAADETHTESVTADMLRDEFLRRGVRRGPALPAPGDVRITAAGPRVHARAGLDMPGHVRAAGRFHLHPVLFDACLQTLSAALMRTHTALDIAPLPVGIDALRIVADPARAARCESWLAPAADGGLRGALRLVDSEGAVVAEAAGVRFARYARGPRRLDPLLHELSWVPSPLDDTGDGAGGDWIVCAAPHDGLAGRLTDLLLDTGAQVDRLAVPTADRSGAAEDQEERFAALEAQVAEALARSAARGRPRRGVVLMLPRAETHQAPPRRAVGSAGLVAMVARACVRAGGGPAPRLWAVARGAQTVCPGEAPDLGQAGVTGVVHVLRWEHPELRATLVDLGADTSDAEDLAAEMAADQDVSAVAWRSGARSVAQITPTPLHDGTWNHRPRRKVAPAMEFAVAAGAPAARPDTVQPMLVRRRPPGTGQVEIRVHAAAPTASPPPADGREAHPVVGVVTRAGGEAGALRAGHRVTGWASGPASTYAVLDAADAAAVPDALSDAEALALPVTAAVWHSLRVQAGLRADDFLLVHDADHAAGRSAIAVARALGARVLATTGSDRARRELAERGVVVVGTGSGDADLPEIARVTGGRVCHAVMHTTAPASGVGVPSALADGGTLLLPAPDAPGSTATLDLSALPAGAGVLTVDWTRPPRSRTAPAAGETLGYVIAQAAARTLAPPSLTGIPLLEAAEAGHACSLTDGAAGTYLEMPRGPVSAVVAPNTIPLARPDGAYVITGGLGALGLRAADWLSAQGAGRVILNGRSAPGADAARAIAALRAAGTAVDLVLGDIGDPGTARRLVARAEAGGTVLRGILHAALTLHDRLVADLKPADLEPTWQAKAAGAWHLHEASAGRPLDWWVNFTSLSALIGMPGLAAYASANAWLDGFAAWRRAQGLPATSIGWGLWAGSALARSYEERGQSALDPEDALEAMGVVLDHELTQVGVFRPDTEHWFADQPALASLPLFAALPRPPAAERAGGTAQPLPALPARASAAERESIWTEFLRGQLGEILGRRPSRIDSDSPFITMGLDSLGAVQLRQRVTTGGQATMSTTAVWRHPTPRLLARHLARQADGPVAGATGDAAALPSEPGSGESAGSGEPA
ncbi:beta-ketoacyl synthase N-terminal-like domain-containing protein [Streptomyces sp. P1-3]|uniref:beta-ketoacyl synthase N-terminal-like domain-containing protein n=1 Tax=Streptomyces sp. P1-3 TaxID=3421658 RepID=UPI003D365EA3